MNIELGADLELELDLEGDTLETLEGELAPVTEEAMNAGESWDTFDFDAPPVGAGNYEIPVDGGQLLLPTWDVPTDGVTKLKLSGDFDLGAGRIVVGNGATLEIFGESNKSIRGYGSHLILVAGGTLKLHGGTVTGQSPYGVFVGQGTFTMDGDEISVTYDGGIGVYNQATFTMEKGKISAEGDGAAGVNNSIVGMFEMNGNAGTCTVSAKGLGAVGVDNDANCTFTMKGGSVTATGDNSQSVLNNGTFTMGAGSEIGGEFVGVTNNSGTFTMNGGEISMPAGASIAVENSGTFNMTGGTISAGDKQATGVNNEGTFNMTGGTISGFDRGVSNASPGTFIMEKDPSDSSTGTISGNNWGVSNNTPFTMKDGRITAARSTPSPTTACAKARR